MKAKKTSLFLICYIIFYLFVIPAHTRAQNLDALDIEKVQDDGLTNTYIINIIQDGNGFMWFGTRDGLFKYDGYNFQAFKNIAADPLNLSGNPIQCLYTERNNLWVGLLGGMSVIDINSQVIKNYPLPGHLPVATIFPKNDSVFWVGTYSGLFQFNKKSFKWQKMPFLGNEAVLESICDDKKGNTYFVVSDGICRYTKLTGECKFYHPVLPYYPKHDKLPKCPIFGKSILDEKGNLWISSWGGGLIQFNTQTEKFKQWLHPTDNVNFLPYNIILDLINDANGNVWFANKEGGLTIFDPAKNKFSNYPVNWRSENKISSAVVSIFKDKWGIVWLGTENGIYKYDPHNIHLSKTDMMLQTDTGAAPAHISPVAMLKDKDGTLWLGMYEGIFIFDQKTNTLHDYSKTFGLDKNRPVFNVLQDDNGAIWLTSYNSLVKVTKQIKHHTISYSTEIFKSPDIKSTMYCLYIDHEKRMWVGTSSSGIFRFDEGSKRFIPYSYHEIGLHSKLKEINVFYELSKDSLLMGGVNTGLLLLHIKSNRYEKVNWRNSLGVPADVSINEIQKIGNDLWMGTEYNGLLKTNKQLKKPEVITVKDGLPAMGIASMVADKQNNLWITTNSGAMEYQTANNKITVFNENDGILDLDELNCLIVDNQGNIVIGSRGCLYNLSPAQIFRNTSPPKVFITNLKIFDKDYNVQKSAPIELNYRQNYFSLEYAGLNYTRSRLNKYAYKMDGLDKKWNDAGSHRYVSYANLEEGTYIFNVKASNNDGVWNNIPARLILIINPPFWHRRWFYLLVIIFFASIIYILYAYNIRQMRLRLQMRDKIARDLHDDIGSTLSGINIFSKIALQQMRPGQPGLELMEKISDRSKITMDALSDIVWSINTRNDTMENFLVKANEYLSVLEAQDIAYDFTMDEALKHVKIGMILKKELYLIFKEAVCNASKYSRCSFMQIYLTCHKDVCTLSIHDNGIGFNILSMSLGNGIYNMQQRAKKMNADLHIESDKNDGTTVSLKFRITQYR